MLHLRIIAPGDTADRALELLTKAPAVLNIVHLRDAARNPDGDLLLCDVAREDASVILSDLRELGIPEEGSIAIIPIDTSISTAADRAEKAAKGLPSDAVVWEEVEARTSETAELSATFLAFMVLATLIGSVGVLLDSPILIIGAMVVGPEFGPIAGVCVAAVQRRSDLARRSALALAVGFPLAIAITYVVTLLLRATGAASDDYESASHPLTEFISKPDVFSILVALFAGVAGVLSLTSAKSGALVGVLISVTTIPAAANVSVAAAYTDWSEVAGAASQLVINLACILLAGVGTLMVQRRLYVIRRRRHLGGPSRDAADLPERPAASSSAGSPDAGVPRG